MSCCRGIAAVSVIPAVTVLHCQKILADFLKVHYLILTIVSSSLSLPFMFPFSFSIFVIVSFFFPLQITSELYVPVTFKDTLLDLCIHWNWMHDSLSRDLFSLSAFKVDTNIHPTIFPGSFSVRSIYWLDQHIDVLMLVQRQNREEMRSTGKWKKTSRTSSFIIPLNADHMMVSSAVLFISGFTCPSANCESELRFWGIFPFSPVLIHDLSALPLLIGVY